MQLQEPQFFRPAWNFAKINALNLVFLTKESQFLKEQS